PTGWRGTSPPAPLPTPSAAAPVPLAVPLPTSPAPLPTSPPGLRDGGGVCVWDGAWAGGFWGFWARTFWAPMAKANAKSAMEGVENVWRTDEPSLLIRCDGEGFELCSKTPLCRLPPSPRQ